MRFRVIATLAVLVAALGVLAVGVGTAGATIQDSAYLANPQTTNIPWLAWAGETVKVSRCFGLGNSEVKADSFQNSDYNKGSSIWGEFDKADWSGATDQPPFFQTGTGDETSRQVQPTWNANGGICFSTNVTSEKAGLEKIKFSISVDLDKWLHFLLGPQLVFQQDLYVIWMWDTSPTLTEEDTTGAYAVGDPGGNGSFSPIADDNGVKHLYPGLVKVLVKGSFPLGNDYATYDRTGPGDPAVVDGNGNIVLPDSWAWLAEHFAEDYSLASTYPGATPYRWDIHDDQTNVEGHVASSGCASPLGPIEAVDTCWGTTGDPDLGPFSSIFGGVGPAYGPFDPIRSWQTLLSDGNLNADDAPMPALRVDVSLTNAGADHSAGYLSKADKSLIFNRNDPAYGGNGDNLSDPHMMYAPFYKAYIPAVVPILDANTDSGVAGQIGGNYGNWLTSGAYGVSTSEDEAFTYDYWDTFTLDSAGGYNGCKDVSGHWISQPDTTEEPGSGTSVAVYTDEHGEAYVQFNPANPDGEGIVLTPDSNGRCDVYTGSLVGTATIQAESVYPAQQPSDPSNSGQPKLSSVITKTVNFTPSKVLTCMPKATNEAFCVETVTDFEGNPLPGAWVEFNAQSATGSEPKIGADSAVVGDYDTTGQYVVSGGPVNGGFVVLKTGANGEAGIYVHSSTNACVDVTVENKGTRNGGSGITRDFDFNPTSGAVCSTGGTDNSGSGSGSSGGTDTSGGSGSSGGSDSSSSSTTSVVTAAPVSVSSPAPTAAPAVAPKATPAATAKQTKVQHGFKMTLVKARVVKTKQGLRYLKVRVNSKAKMARLHITMVNKHGKRVTKTRYVRTNHLVLVQHLRLAPGIKSVRVAIA